jgi:hypothetical protein
MKIINIIKNLKFIFMPNYWIMDDYYSEQWDEKFQELAEKYDFVPDNEHECEFGSRTYTVFLGEYRVWVGNYPYAFFRYNGKTSEPSRVYDMRPSRRTIAKYYKKLVKDLAKHNCKHR